jgi:hypothetical protein
LFRFVSSGDRSLASRLGVASHVHVPVPVSNCVHPRTNTPQFCFATVLTVHVRAEGAQSVVNGLRGELPSSSPSSVGGSRWQESSRWEDESCSAVIANVCNLWLRSRPLKGSCASGSRARRRISTIEPFSSESHLQPIRTHRHRHPLQTCQVCLFGSNEYDTIDVKEGARWYIARTRRAYQGFKFLIRSGLLLFCSPTLAIPHAPPLFVQLTFIQLYGTSSGAQTVSREKKREARPRTSIAIDSPSARVR